jgi:multidrug efflux pump
MATSEVAMPVIASTLTTVAAFFPLLFWPGIMGQFMRYLPITVIITLSSSLFVAMVINPAMAAIFMRLPSGSRHGEVKTSA